MVGVGDCDERRVGSGSHVVHRPDVRLDRRAEARVHYPQLPEIAGLEAEQAQNAAVVAVAERQTEIGQPGSQDGGRDQAHGSPPRPEACYEGAEGRSQRGHSPALIGPP